MDQLVIKAWWFDQVSQQAANVTKLTIALGERDAKIAELEKAMADAGQAEKGVTP